MIPRIIEKRLSDAVVPGCVVIIYGPRRAGKTTFISEFTRSFTGSMRIETGDNSAVRSLFDTASLDKLLTAYRGIDLLVIDEAQMIPMLGSGLKMLVDNLPSLKIIASGSSSFEIANQVGEPLTGRKRTLTLLPISCEELIRERGTVAVDGMLEDCLIYGMYPEVITASSEIEKRRYIHELTEDYLFKDIIAFEGLRASDKIRKLLILLSYQIGKEVSLSELGTQLSMSKQLIDRYLDLLEKTFIIKRVDGFSKNLRSEVSKSSRYYFVDNGVLCDIQNNHAPLSTRGDVGALWENWLAMERIKYNLYNETFKNVYFWRTYAKQEIDFVEEGDGKLSGFEFKWGNKKYKTPSEWESAYPNAEFTVINRDNFESFVAPHV